MVVTWLQIYTCDMEMFNIIFFKWNTHWGLGVCELFQVQDGSFNVSIWVFLKFPFFKKKKGCVCVWGGYTYMLLVLLSQRTTVFAPAACKANTQAAAMTRLVWLALVFEFCEPAVWLCIRQGLRQSSSFKTHTHARAPQGQLIEPGQGGVH